MLKMGFAIRKFDKHNSYKAYLFYHQTFELHREWGTNKKKYRSIVLRNSFKKKYKGSFKSFENMPLRKIENWCQKRKYSVDLLDAIVL